MILEKATMLRFCFLILFLFNFCRNISALKNCTKINDKLWKNEFSIEFRDFEELYKNFYISDCICKLPMNCSEYCENIEVKNDHVFMKAKHKQYDLHNFSSLQIDSKEYFSYGRYEIKARLPHNDYLYASAFLKTNIPGVKTDEIMIFKYNQNEYLYREVHFRNFQSLTLDARLNFSTRENASNQLSSRFHLYGIEWKRARLRFFHDDHYTDWHKFNPKENITSWFSLQFRLGVDGEKYHNNNNNKSSHSRTSTCSALILDYFRFYKFAEKEECENVIEIEKNENEYLKNNKMNLSCFEYTPDNEDNQAEVGGSETLKFDIFQIKSKSFGRSFFKS